MTNPNNDKNIPPHNPSLQKSGSNDDAGMRTNLYMDNVVREEMTEKQDYCSASEISDNPNEICNTFAQNHGYELVPGSCQWDTSIMQSDGQCLATVKGNYNQKVMGCDKSNFGDATSYCPLIMDNNSVLVPGTARWGDRSRAGNICKANAIAEYQPQNCDYKCSKKYIYGIEIYSCGDMVNSVCMNDNQFFLLGILDVAADGYVHGDLNNGACQIHITCITFPGLKKVHSGRIPPNILGQSTTKTCSPGTAELSPDSIIPLGYISGGTILKDPFNKTVVIPADHRYRAIKLGNNGANQDVSIKSDAPAGAAYTTSRLDINHAGIQSGQIAIVSHLVQFGDICQPTELGKMAQQRSAQDNDVQAQLICTYSPVSCPDPGYCYLPVKSASREINFKQAQSIATCPNGLVLDAEQPNNFFDTNAKCQDLTNQGFLPNPELRREVVGCYQSGKKGINFCTTVQSTCVYKDKIGNTHSYPAYAILGIKCIAKSNTFVVDNYKQN